MNNSSMISSSSNPLEVEKPRRSRWKTLQNVLRASNSLRSTEVKVINDVEELVTDLNVTAAVIKTSQPKSLVIDAIDQFRAHQQLFFFIKRSSADDLDSIKSLIENHPLRYLRTSSDSNSFLNKEDLFGVRPVYEACRNGHKNTTVLLIELGANPKLLSNGENCLQVACRWGFLEIIKILMVYAKWSEKEIQSGMKETKNKTIHHLLKGFLPGVKKWFWCCGRK
jgi:hypothetical protein